MLPPTATTAWEGCTRSPTRWGSFTYNFVRNTGRLESVAYPNGQSTQYAYFGGMNAVADPRLQSIRNLTSTGAMLSQFDYTFDAVGNIATWKQDNPQLASARTYSFGYDGIDELTSAVLDAGGGGNPGWQSFTYDAAMNRTSVQEGNRVATETPNGLNQLTGSAGGGPMRFAGTVSKPAAVTVGGNAASVKADGTYEGWAQVAATGTTRVHIVATDSASHVTDKYTDVTPGTVTAQSFSYDPSGNQTAAGPSGSQTTYGWDAADRLVSITQGGDVTRFDYDGQGRRVRESLNGAERKRWVWAGLSLAEERDAGNSVTKRFFAQGEQIAGQAYFFARDHLGSVRELTDSTQTTKARYNYDVWGQRSSNQITSNPVEADFGFTGHYLHVASGLHMALYRAYDAKTSRWISRDLVAESEGPSLYVYVSNNPMKFLDPLGLAELITDEENGLTTFVDDSGTPTIFASSNVSMSDSSKGAEGNYKSGNIYIAKGPYKNDSEDYGPNDIIKTDDDRGRWIHGGGRGLDDPSAPYQGWYPTHGCTRMQNDDLSRLLDIIREYKRSNPGKSIPYSRIGSPPARSPLITGQGVPKA